MSGLGFVPRLGRPQGLCMSFPPHPVPQPPGDPGTRQHVQPPGLWLPRQICHPRRLPCVAFASNLWACRADEKPIREVTVALKGGKRRLPSTCTNRGPLSPSLGWGPGTEGPRSASLLRSFSCRHNTL